MKKTIFIMIAMTISTVTFARAESFSGEEYQKAKAILVESLRHKLQKK